jgi:hypothetical protein
LAFASAVVAFSTPALADTIEDPLHGVCNGAGACADNGTNTPLGNSTTFGFSISPGPQTGDLVLDILVPNNYALPANFAISGTQGGAANNLAISATANLFSTTAWTGGTLADYLGIGASPNNPLDAYLPTTVLKDPGATGFFVFQADTGTSKIWDNANAGNGPVFSIITGLSGDSGAYIVGFCGTGCTGNANPYVATANSGALLVGGTTNVPEPSSFLMLGAGLLGLAVLASRRSLTA